MKFIKILKNNLSLFFCFICHSRENGNPESANNTLDSRLRGNDRRNPNACKSLTFRNLQPTIYNPASSAGKPQPSPRNLPPTTYHLPPSRGFTLIETLVAISILMIAVASPLTIAQKGLASAIYAKDQIIASYLAQDAIEYIINASGQNVLDSTPRDWLYGIKDPCDATLGKKCTVDTSNDIIANCSNGSCSPLKYDYNETSSSHIYRYTEPTNSPFTRSVTVSETVVGVEALITVTVSWKDKNTDRILNFYTRIYNWKS